MQEVPGPLERGDAVGVASVGDIDVDLRRSYVDVAGERPDDCECDAAFGERGVPLPHVCVVQR
jgi:hypothetical protein